MNRTYFIQYLALPKIVNYKRRIFFGFLMLPLFLTACGGSTISTSTPIEETPVSTVPASSATYKWKYQTGDELVTTAVTLGDKVFVASEDNILYALMKSSGELAWQFETPDTIWDGTILAGDSIIYIASKGANFYALDADTGATLWSRNFGSDGIEIHKAPLLQDGKLYIATTYVWFGMPRNRQGNARLIVIDAETGSDAWEFTSGNYLLTPAFVDSDTVYLGGDWDGPPVDEGGNTQIYSLDLASCEAGSCNVNWAYKSEDGYPKTVFSYGGIVTYLAYRDAIRGLDASTGTLAWSYPTFNWSPSFTNKDGNIYFSSANNTVHAVDATTGERLWRFSTVELGGTYMNYTVGAPLIIDDVMYLFTILEKKIVAVNVQDGSLIWNIETDVEAGVAPVVTGNTVGEMIFISSVDGALYAYEME